MRILVTGGAGFIGSNFVRLLLANDHQAEVVNFDALTYAGNLENLASLADEPRHTFVRGDIANAAAVERVVVTGFDAVVNFAAETHVDRSIEDAAPFLRTNVIGVHVLLEAARRHRVPRFVHISTDEVYGSAPPGKEFNEASPLNAGSPYAASKAAADLLVGAYANTFGLAVVVVRCTNNYGPYQFPEKLIPLMIANAMEGKRLPVYGDGMHERDWLFVEDFARAIERALRHGRPGEVYNVSSGSPTPNLAVVRTILKLLGGPESLIEFVADRPGHDRRYALDCSKIRRELGWRPQVGFEEGMESTIRWYQQNAAWLASTRSGEYRQYYDRHYTRRAELLGRVVAGS